MNQARTVLIADSIAPSAVALIKEASWNIVAPPEADAAELMRLIPGCDAIVVRSRTRVTAELMAAAPKLKLIARAGVGVDTIDVPAAEARGITVLNAPGSNSRSVAEHTIGLLFALARHIPEANNSMHQGKWEKKLFSGSELQGKTIGVMGFGYVGKIVAGMAAALGLTVVVCTKDAVNNTPYRMVGALDELLPQVDYLTLHVPKTPATTNCISARELALMKPGACVINTARGGIINESDLVAALDSGHLAGAALDVFENEPTPNAALAQHPRVIATPHIAALTGEAQVQAGEQVVRDMIAWFDKQSS